MSAESSLGAYFRHWRERSGLSVDAVSAGSRIGTPYVRALEGDRFDLLPASVYVRGFIRAYCEQVGVDAEEALARYEAHLASTPAAPLRPAPAVLVPPRPPARRWRSAVAGAALVVGLGLAATFVVGVVARGRQPAAITSRNPASSVARSPASASPSTSAAGVGPSTEVPREAAPPPASAAPPAPGARPRAVPSAPSVATAPALPPAAPASPTGERVLRVRAMETTWVRVAPDRAPVTEETLSPGAVREWRSARPFRVSLGNAAGVEIELDGQPLPVLGQRGQVVHRTIPDEARP